MQRMGLLASAHADRSEPSGVGPEIEHVYLNRCGPQAPVIASEEEAMEWAAAILRTRYSTDPAKCRRGIARLND